MQKRISLKDIASQLGVSTALVSYVLNGKEKEARVGADMAKKVKRAAAKLNYQPNLIARGLKSGKTKTIGLIVADIANPFFSSLARIIENEAQLHGYTVIFGSSDEQIDKSKNLIHTLLSRQVDGLIIAPVEGSEGQFHELAKKKINFVLIDRAFDGKENNAVLIDNYDASYQAASLLIKNGYKKVGMIAYDTSLTHMKERVAGYKAALKANGVLFKPNQLLRVSYDNTKNDVEDAIDTLFGKKNKIADAMIFATNSISINALRYIQQLQIAVPEELGIICFDESEVFDFFYSPVSYIKQNLEAIGQSAVQTLISNIEQKTMPQKIAPIPIQMVERQSSRGVV